MSPIATQTDAEPGGPRSILVRQRRDRVPLLPFGEPTETRRAG